MKLPSGPNEPLGRAHCLPEGSLFKKLALGSAGIWHLHSYGLLQASFRPADQMGVWGSCWRYHEELIWARGVRCQHIQKALLAVWSYYG